MQGHPGQAVAGDGITLDDVVVGGGTGERREHADAGTLALDPVVHHDVVAHGVVIHATECRHELAGRGVPAQAVRGERDPAVIGVVGDDVARDEVAVSRPELVSQQDPAGVVGHGVERDARVRHAPEVDTLAAVAGDVAGFLALGVRRRRDIGRQTALIVVHDNVVRDRHPADRHARVQLGAPDQRTLHRGRLLGEDALAGGVLDREARDRDVRSRDLHAVVEPGRVDGGSLAAERQRLRDGNGLLVGPGAHDDRVARRRRGDRGGDGAVGSRGARGSGTAGHPGR